MILGDLNASQMLPGGRTTLDDLFKRAAARRPDAIALADPPNRASFTHGAPRQLTHAQADRIVDAIAGRLRRLGLAADSVVGLQLPNTVESALTLLGILRAGMIAAPLPLLWRRAEIAAAMTRLSARVLIVGGKVGNCDHAALAIAVAAEVFPIRYVCGYGPDRPDGIIPFDGVLTESESAPDAAEKPSGNAAAHIAIVTWDMIPAGAVPVARNHMQLIAGGLAAMLEARIPEDSSILTATAGSSFAGLALGLMPWLLTGGTLALHHPFDAETFVQQASEHSCNVVVLPGPLAASLDEAGLLSHSGLRHVVAAWHAPERLVTAAPWRNQSAGLVDALVFGETALVAARRDEAGLPAPLLPGTVNVPRGAAGGMVVAEIARTEAGTLAFSGPMVAQHAFPAGSELWGVPHLTADAEGRVDSGFGARLDDGVLVVSAPPPGILGIGGYRMRLRDLAEHAQQSGGGLNALPDSLAGHRLAGEASDVEAARREFAANGAGALVADAFRDRRRDDAA